MTIARGLRAVLAVALAWAGAAAAFPTAPYYPLPDGATWTYSVSDGTSETRTVTGSATFNGAPVRVIRTNSGDENYFSNDPVTGIRFHGGLFVDPTGDETDTYSPPLLLAAPDMALGVPATSAGTVTAVVGVDSFAASYSATSTVIAIEPQFGTFQNVVVVRTVVSYGPPFDFSQTIDTWLAFGVGTIREVASDTLEPTVITSELASYSVPDVVPDEFAFAPKTSAVAFVAVDSDPIAVQGISAPAPVSVSAGGFYSVNGGAFTSAPGTVQNGDQVVLRVQAPAPGNSASATLSIGGVSATFTVSVSADTQPDAFSFAPAVGAPPGVLIDSGTASVTGINADAPISISGGEYAICAPAPVYTSAPGTIFPGGCVRVRVAAAATPGTTTSAILTIGGASAAFSVTTAAAAAGPISVLYFVSDPGEYIGGGLTRVLGAAGGASFELERNFNAGITARVLALPSSDFRLELDAAGSAPVTRGRHEGAVRFPFNGEGAGLSLSGEARGCNALSGSFDVIEVAYASDGAVERLAVNFVQHCENLPPALRGELRFNSAFALGTVLDLAAPGVPGVFAQALKPTQVDLSWGAVSDNVGVAQYRVARDGVLIATLPGTTFGYSDTGLVPDTLYSYMVSACDAQGNCSAQSAPSLARTLPPDTVAPGEAATLTGAAVSARQVDLAWSEASDNYGVSEYRIWRDGVQVASVPGSVLRYADAALAASSSYRYTVQACDEAGNCSGHSPAASVSTLAAGMVQFTPELPPGWNLAGNVLDSALAVPEFLGAAAARVVSVWKWEALEQKWAFYSPLFTPQGNVDYAASNGYLVLAGIAPGEGYWVNATEPIALPAQAGSAFVLDAAGFAALPAQWNLLALYPGAPLSPSGFNQAMGPGNFISLWQWDALQQKWWFYSPLIEAAGGLSAVREYVEANGYLDFESTYPPFTSAPKRLGLGEGFWVSKP